MSKYSFAILFFLIGLSMSAQEIRNAYIVDLYEGKSSLFLKDIQAIYYDETIIDIKVLSGDLEIYLIKMENEDGTFESFLRSQNYIESWGYDRYTQARKSPNDDFFPNQTNMDVIQAEDAWNKTTGGLDANGREIVVVVMDDGYNLEHPDLADQIFYNEGEIPDDGIDNDGNGYIDDFSGWNSTDDTDNHIYIDRHGIAVAGIIGAKGDNDIGVSGVNWDVKILPITGIETQSIVIAGYQYAITMRRLYNETNGEKGAFIVATNYSAGINNGDGSSPEFQSWCAMYDAMGEVGILSAGATSNELVNVDEVGDIPSTCISEYLITVTNSSKEDTLYKAAGFGPIHVDIAAPGDDIWVLDNNNGYNDGFTGTSASTPHVAGAIALLYSSNCELLADLSLSSPRLAAEMVRDALYAGADVLDAFTDKVRIGGRLNLKGALDELEEACELQNKPKLVNIQYTNDVAKIEYATPINTPYSLLISDASGRAILRQEFTPPQTGLKELTVSIPDLPLGIYIFSIYNDESISSRKVFIYQNE